MMRMFEEFTDTRVTEIPWMIRPQWQSLGLESLGVTEEQIGTPIELWNSRVRHRLYPPGSRGYSPTTFADLVAIMD